MLMTLLFSISDITLPITNQVLKFLIILVIILLAPIVLNKIKIPHLLGLIISGAVIGPFGFNLIDRDEGILLLGTAGLLYIMFLAGLEISLADFKKNSGKSIVFGLYTFLIPMGLGVLVGYYVLGYTLPTSILLASMFASHTLITYPIVSKLGITKNKAVNITVGGTLITDTLALLILAVIVGMATGEVNSQFWIKLSVSFVIFGLIIMVLFPIIARWFFKKYDDSVTQYIFVLTMVFLGAGLAEVAGVEGIIGAFLTGLALNRLIPRTSPLMNRIEFVGNAIFIPFFLIGVGMLINYRAFFLDFETIKVAVIMTVIATVAKFSAAWLTQKTFRFSVDQRNIIFGLSNAQAAATLAAVLVGYNTITGYTDAGEPIRLLSESVLNGTIVMILITCTIASFATQKGAQNLSLSEASSSDDDDKTDLPQERILIPIGNIENTNELVNLSVTIKSKKRKGALYALSIVNNNSPKAGEDKQAQKILEQAAKTAAATDNYLHELLRYDINVVNGILGAVKEHKITNLVLGLHQQGSISDSFLGNLVEGILNKCNITTLIYKPSQPLATVKRHLIFMPERAEREIGFSLWLGKIWNMAQNTGAKLVFYGSQDTFKLIEKNNKRQPIECSFVEFTDWNDFLIISRDVQHDDNLVVVLSRKDKISYHNNMENIPNYLNKYFTTSSFILIFPMQVGIGDSSSFDINNASII